jgi:hypothetical protein
MPVQVGDPTPSSQVVHNGAQQLPNLPGNAESLDEQALIAEI